MSLRLVRIKGCMYYYRDPGSGRYPWFCCQKCGCAEIGGFIGRLKMRFGYVDHNCIERTNSGYHTQDFMSREQDEEFIIS